jgi:hypothetical protein
LFGGLFGIGGMIVGVPIFAVIYAALRAFVNAILLRKNIPVESDKYIYISAIQADGNMNKIIPEYKIRKKHRSKTNYGERFMSKMELQGMNTQGKVPEEVIEEVIEEVSNDEADKSSENKDNE